MVHYVNMKQGTALVGISLLSQPERYNTLSPTNVVRDALFRP